MIVIDILYVRNTARSFVLDLKGTAPWGGSAGVSWKVPGSCSRTHHSRSHPDRLIRTKKVLLFNQDE